MVKDLRLAVCISPAVLIACTTAASLCAQPPTPVIDGSAPLFRAAVQLGGRYAVAVTYEDPILLWHGDILLTGNNPESAVSYEARAQHLQVPEELTPGVTPKLNGEAIGKLLDAYHSANPDGRRFKVLETGYGLHILPDTVRGQGGLPVPATTPLDATVTVPGGERMATEHLQALSDAVARASGIHLILNDGWVDQYYAANGLMPSKNVLVPLLLGQGGDAAKRPYSFVWGGSNVTGREALLSLLGGSATTLAWYVTCHPHPTPGRGYCMLSVTPLRVPFTGLDGVAHERELGFDRCNKCPPLPPPPPLRPQQ